MALEPVLQKQRFKLGLVHFHDAVGRSVMCLQYAFRVISGPIYLRAHWFIVKGVMVGLEAVLYLDEGMRIISLQGEDRAKVASLL